MLICLFLQCTQHFVRREQMYPLGSSSTAENVFPTSMRCVPKTRLSHCQFETNHLFPFHSPFMKWHCFSWLLLELTVVCSVSDLNTAAGLKPHARQTGMLIEAVKVLKVLFQKSLFFTFQVKLSFTCAVVQFYQVLFREPHKYLQPEDDYNMGEFY